MASLRPERQVDSPDVHRAIVESAGPPRGLGITYGASTQGSLDYIGRKFQRLQLYFLPYYLTNTY